MKSTKAVLFKSDLNYCLLGAQCETWLTGLPRSLQCVNIVYSRCFNSPFDQISKHFLDAIKNKYTE